MLYGFRNCCLLALVGLNLSRSYASSSLGDSGFTPPVVNWGPAWAASSLQTTVVAIACKSSTIVVLYPGEKLTAIQTDEWIERDNLRVSLHHYSDHLPKQKRWSDIGSKAVIFMTGLASDVDYLLRVLLEHVESDRILFDQSRCTPAISVVQKLTNQIQNEAKYKSGRPFGVQGLVLGQNSRGTTSLFTVDPSGSYRSWGCATAIGRNASAVRGRLHRSMLDHKGNLTSGVGLRIALDSLRDSIKKPIRRDEDVPPEAFLIWTIGESLCVGTVDPSVVIEHLQTFSDDTGL